MRKRIMTVAFLSFAILTQSNCMAAYSGEVQNGKIIIKGEELLPGATVNLTAFPKGTEPEKAEELIAMEEKTVGDDGKIEFEIGVRIDKAETKNAEGVTVYIKEDGKDTESVEVNYSIKNYNVFIDSLKSASADNLSEVFANPDYKEVMTEFGMAEYFEISSDSVKKDTVRLFAAALDKSDVTPAKVNETYIKAYAVAKLNARIGSAADAIEKLNPEFEGTNFKSVTDEKLKKWLAENALTRTYSNIDEYEKAYELDNILYVINNSKSAKIEENLAKYADNLGIKDDTYYNKYILLGTTPKGKASDKMVSALSENPAKSADDVKDVIKSSQSSGSNSNGGGSNGGSSSGGSSKVFASGNSKGDFTVPPTTDNKKDDEEKHSFNDMENAAWASEAVEFLYEKGIVSGVTDTEFEPNAPVTREQFVKLVVSATGVLDETAETEFEDTDGNSWYYKYVASGVKAGFISGISDTEFGTGREITRQDAAVILYRAAKTSGVSMEVKSEQSFSDSDEIAEYAKEAVAVLSGMGVINGMDNGVFAPEATCTRAQAAQIIYRLFFA